MNIFYNYFINFHKSTFKKKYLKQISKIETFLSLKYDYSFFRNDFPTFNQNINIILSTHDKIMISKFCNFLSFIENKQKKKKK